LARQAALDGRELVIAAGGEGTVNEGANGPANTQAVLGLMPLGSVMNVARTLWVPRELNGAARTMVDRKVLAMDMGAAAYATARGSQPADTECWGGDMNEYVQLATIARPGVFGTAFLASKLRSRAVASPDGP
jgi:hypothetical protein